MANFFDQFDAAPVGGAPPASVSAFGQHYMKVQPPSGGPAVYQLVPATGSSAEPTPSVGAAPSQGQAPAGNFFDQFDSAPEGPSNPMAGRGSALDLGINGLTGSFGDEAAGLIGGTLGWLGIGPENTFEGGYNRTVNNIRNRVEDYRTRHPAAATAAEIAGSIPTMALIPGGAAAEGATWIARAGRSAVTGAGLGALYGAGEANGDLGDRVKGALGGAVTGAVTGGLASPVIDMAAVGGRVIGQRASSAVRGIINPDAEAARRIAAARQRDIAAGANTLTPADEAIAAQAGQPVTNIDRGGEVTRALARSAANTSPEARQALGRMIDDRFAGQGDRTSTFLLGLVRTPGNATETREALQLAARRANRPAYGRAYAEGDRGIWTPELERLASSPAVVSAMRSAAVRGKDRSVTEGFGGFNPGVTVSDSGQVTFRRGQGGVPTYPNLQYWDYVKRELDDAANAARRAGRNEEAATTGALASQLRDVLDAEVPSYAAARAGAARFFGANDALEAGSLFVRSNAPIAEARRALARMSQPERELFREGFLSALLDMVARIGDRRNIVNAIWGSPQAREKIEVALGPQAARRLEAFMRVETLLDMARGAIQGNSTTARQLAEIGLAGGSGALVSGGNLNDPSFWITAMLVRGARFGTAQLGQRVNQRLAQRVAEMLTSNDPAVFQRGMQVMTGSPALMDALRRVFTRTSAATGGRSSLPVFGGASPVPAQENQPN